MKKFDGYWYCVLNTLFIIGLFSGLSRQAWADMWKKEEIAEGQVLPFIA